MDAYTNIQVINDSQGNPEFAIIPYSNYIQFVGFDGQDLRVDYSAEVVKFNAIQQHSLIKSWRLYLKLSPAQAAQKIGIPEPAYNQIENSGSPDLEDLEKIAIAFGVEVNQ